MLTSYIQWGAKTYFFCGVEEIEESTRIINQLTVGIGL